MYDHNITMNVCDLVMCFLMNFLVIFNDHGIFFLINLSLVFYINLYTKFAIKFIKELCISLQLLVYGAGQVVPSSLIILEPNLKYSLFVGISSGIQYGRLVLVMDRNFCTDAAGNTFIRSANSSFYVHFGEFSYLLTIIHFNIYVTFKITY